MNQSACFLLEEITNIGPRKKQIPLKRFSLAKFIDYLTRSITMSRQQFNFYSLMQQPAAQQQQ
jgi:hypothetical protein